MKLYRDYQLVTLVIHFLRLRDKLPKNQALQELNYLDSQVSNNPDKSTVRD